MPSSNDKSTPNADLEEFQKVRLEEKAEQIAKALERMAEDVRQQAKFETVHGMIPITRYGAVVGRIQHTVLWGMANLGLDYLPSVAADADVAAVRGVYPGEG